MNIQWIVTMRHDGGTVDIRTAAKTKRDAVSLVCAAEHAPHSAVVGVRRWVAVAFSQDLVIPDGSDTSPDGDGCEPGHGAVRESGWVNLAWDIWSVSEDFHPDAHRLEYDADDAEDFTPVGWLADMLRRHLEGWPEREFNEMSPTIYGGTYEHPYEGKSRTLAAHPEGFTAEEIRAAIDAARGGN